jgi:serine/threonine-protein kinase
MSSGQRVGPYELLEEIGAGGMATVFLGRQSTTGRLVAVKLIHQAMAGNKVAMERFQREAEVIAHLEHPHILPVYDYDAQHLPPYIVMRYMPTGTLKEIMERSSLPLEDIALMYQQLGSALDYAHRKGVVHRDIKPSNVMVDGDGNVFLTDFGIARMADKSSGTLTGTGMTVGTPGYMAPEQATDSLVDGRADNYALGVMLYELLVGQPPYQAETPIALLLKHISDPIPTASTMKGDLLPSLDAILQQALAKDPKQRFQRASDMSEALAQVVRPAAKPTRLADLAQATIQELEAQRPFTSTDAGDANTFIGATPPRLTGAGSKATPATAMTPLSSTPPARRLSPILIILGLGLLLVGLIAVGLLASGGAEEPTPEAQITVTATRPTLTASASPVASDTSAASLGQATAEFTEEVAQAANASFTSTESPSPTTTKTATPTASVTPTNTPTFTATPTNSATATDSPSPTATPADAQARIRVTRATVYLEPNINAAVISEIPEGVSLLTVGQTQDGVWYQVDAFGQLGWILRDQVDVTGNLTTILTILPSETPTPTITPSFTPTNLPSATPSFTASPTNLPSATPTNLPSATPTLAPTEVAIEEALPGALPYIADFEDANPLENWLYLPDQWSVITDGGNTALYGQTGYDNSLTLLGQVVPEWLSPEQDDLLLAFRVNLLEGNSGGRFIFKFDPDNGYYVLELLSGRILLKRGPAGVLPDRPNERVIADLPGANITTGRWYEFAIWTEGQRTFVYQDNVLIMQAEDRQTPLPPGQILLQTFSSQANPVGWDDLTVKRPDPSSDHFQGANFPTTWARSNQQNVYLSDVGDGNQYIEMVGEAETSPITEALGDFILYAHLNNTAVSFKMHVRESPTNQARLELDWDAGNVTLTQYNTEGQVIFSQQLRNYYARGRFKAFVISIIGEQVVIYNGTDIVFDQGLTGLPPTGFIRFMTDEGDGLRIDDVLIANTAKSSTADAEFAFEILAELEARPLRPLRWDWEDDFSDRFATRNFWVGNLDGDPGQYLVNNDLVSQGLPHGKYYQLQSGEFPVYRLFNRTVDSTLTVFGNGRDSEAFRDSVDLFVQVDMRLPDQAAIGSSAWVGVRTEEMASGGLDQYRVTLLKNEAGQTVLQVGPDLATDRTPIYEVILPSTDWVQIQIVLLDDRMAVFADGRLQAAINDLELLGGTVAVGVGPNSLAQFDDLLIRDTSVNE